MSKNSQPSSSSEWKGKRKARRSSGRKSHGGYCEDAAAAHINYQPKNKPDKDFHDELDYIFCFSFNVELGSNSFQYQKENFEIFISDVRCENSHKDNVKGTKLIDNINVNQIHDSRQTVKKEKMKNDSVVNQIHDSKQTVKNEKKNDKDVRLSDEKIESHKYKHVKTDFNKPIAMNVKPVKFRKPIRFPNGKFSNVKKQNMQTHEAEDDTAKKTEHFENGLDVTNMPTIYPWIPLVFSDNPPYDLPEFGSPEYYMQGF